MSSRELVYNKLEFGGPPGTPRQLWLLPRVNERYPRQVKTIGQLPLELDSPIARIESKRFPFGKLVVRKIKDEQLEIEIDAVFRPFLSSVRWRAEVWKKLRTLPSNILIYTNANQVTATINGDEMPIKSEIRNGHKVWAIDPYARIPGIRDYVGKQRGWLYHDLMLH